MNLQYILDGKGETTGVFIPIQEWLSSKKKFKNVDLETDEIPDWHKKEIDKILDDIKNGKEEFQDFNDAIDELEKGL